MTSPVKFGVDACDRGVSDEVEHCLCSAGGRSFVRQRIMFRAAFASRFFSCELRHSVEQHRRNPLILRPSRFSSAFTDCSSLLQS